MAHQARHGSRRYPAEILKIEAGANECLQPTQNHLESPTVKTCIRVDNPSSPKGEAVTTSRAPPRNRLEIGPVADISLFDRALLPKFLDPDDCLASIRESHLVGPGHNDRLFWTGIDAVAAIDASQKIDLVDSRNLLMGDFFARVFFSNDVDAVRRAGGLTHIAGDTTKFPVVPGRQDVAATETFGILSLDLRIFDGGNILFSEEIPEKMAKRDAESGENRAEVDPLQQGGGGSVNIDCRYVLHHLSNSPAMIFRLPMIAMRSGTICPLMRWGKAWKIAKQGGLTLTR